MIVSISFVLVVISPFSFIILLIEPSLFSFGLVWPMVYNLIDSFKIAASSFIDAFYCISSFYLIDLHSNLDYFTSCVWGWFNLLLMLQFFKVQSLTDLTHHFIDLFGHRNESEYVCVCMYMCKAITLDLRKYFLSQDILLSYHLYQKNIIFQNEANTFKCGNISHAIGE